MENSFERNLELIADLLDNRTIAFRREFAEIAESASGGLFLSQAYYWSRQKRSESGWFFKSQEDWTKEACLTRYEQEGARKILVKKGVLEEKKFGLPFRLHFRVNVLNLYNILAIQSAENNKLVCGIPADQLAEFNKPYKEAESTTESTTEKEHSLFPSLGKSSITQESLQGGKKQHVPLWVPLAEWLEFEAMRKQIGAPLTPGARVRAWNTLERLSDRNQEKAAAVLLRSVDNCWKGLYSEEQSKYGKPETSIPVPVNVLEEKRRKEEERRKRDGNR